MAIPVFEQLVERDYGIAAHMLDSLRVRSVRLITSNPKKVDGLSSRRTR